MRRVATALPTEHAEQVAVVEYLHRFYPDALFWSTPNGAHFFGGPKQRFGMVNKVKREGMLPGVSDLIVFEPRGGYSALFLEMKRERGGELHENQMWFLREVEKRGGFGAVAQGFDEARQIVDDYLTGKIVVGCA